MNLDLKLSRGPYDNDITAIETRQRPIQTNDYYAFGQLLAYCYYLGIQDMHKDNVLLSHDGLQVIDAEQAFSELLLPNQTLLLPANRGITWSAGLNLLTNLTLEQLAKLEAKALLDGFLDLTTFFLRELAAIRSVLLAALPDLKQQPIRIFFRGTREYVEDLDGKTKLTDCFEEETAQLGRGDVPYFFMFLGKELVYFYSSETWDIKVVQVPESFKKFVTYCAREPADLFNQVKIEQQWARGMLYLAKKMPSLVEKDLIWNACSITRGASQLDFVSRSLRMASKS